MLQTINCQLIFALIYCAYVAGNILYCTLYICMYIHLLVFQFSLLSTFCQCQMWQQMRKYAWTRVAVVVSVSSPPSPYQTNHKNRISFRLFISVPLFPFFFCCVFLCFLLCFYRQQSVKWRCLLSFQLWRKTWQIKMRIHSSHALPGGAKGGGRGACTHVMPGAILL